MTAAEIRHRWFSPDHDGNVMDDGDLAYAIVADDLETDFVADVRALLDALDAAAAVLAEKP